MTGVEISEKRRLFGERHLGVNIVNDIDVLKENSFDIVYTSHALEHFTNISEIFAKIYLLLTEGGKLIIEVPNFDFEKFGDRVLSIIGAVHPLGYSSKFFSANLPDYGFKLLGYYDSWETFPSIKLESRSKNNIILLAEKLT